MLLLQADEQVLSNIFFGVALNGDTFPLRLRCERTEYIGRRCFQAYDCSVHIYIVGTPYLDILLVKDSSDVHVSWSIKLLDACEHATQIGRASCRERV